MCLLRAIGLLPMRIKLIENRTSGFEYIPTDLRHLELFKKFQLESGFYSYQDLSALAGLPPPQIDGRGYDIILVDTPTRVAIKRAPGAKVVCVVHDLLPITDLKLSDVATRLFLLRLLTSLRQADELAFVSNYTMSRFRSCFRSSRTCRRGWFIRAPISRCFVRRWLRLPLCDRRGRPSSSSCRRNPGRISMPWSVRSGRCRRPTLS